MRHVIVLTERNFSHYRGEYDAVTHAPYQLGDRLCMCAACRTLVKEEYIADGTCPVCGQLFTAQSINPQAAAPIRVTTLHRDPVILWILSIFAVFLSMTLLQWFAPTIREAYGGISQNTVCFFTLAMAVVTAVIIQNHSAAARCWRQRSWGFWLPFLPAVAPYLVWIAVKLAITALAAVFHMLAAIFVVILVFGVVLSIFSA